MNKRIFGGVLAAVLAITTLTGCGGNNAADVFSQPIEGEITVSAYDAMTYKNYLEEAARRFEAQYPGTKVNIEIAGSMPQVRTQQDGNMMVAIMSNEDSQQEKDDYISKVNTELMSGRGADVIALDILPYYKYADNGQLMDLNDFMTQDSDFNRNDYAANIIDGTKYRGGQFLFPLDYTFNYFSYDSTLYPDFPTRDKLTFTDMINAVQDRAQETGHKIFPFSSYAAMGSSLVMELLNQNYENFIDVANKQVNFNNGEFAAMLETVKEYADEGYINPSMVSDPRAEGGTVNMGAFRQAQQERTYAKSNSNLALTNVFMRGLGSGNRAVMAEGGIGATSENDEIAGLVANDKGDAQFSYNMAFGINSNSQNQRVAWEFVKFLTSEEMQTSGLSRPDSIPVNKNAREQLAAMTITGEAMMRQVGATGVRVDGTEGEKPTNRELTPEQRTALESYLIQIDTFTAQLNKYVVHDEKIDSMIQEELRNFFTGTKSASEVANTLQSKVNLYLNE